MPFVPGVTPEIFAEARARRLAEGLVYPTFADRQARRAAYSLTRHRLRHMEQGRAGTCWVHAAVFLIETFGMARAVAMYPICRRLVGYFGKRLEGGGNPTDGGDPRDALAAMTADRGVGVAHESLAPYTDDSRTLGSPLPPNVLADAKAAHAIKPFDVADLDAAEALIDDDTPVGIAIWWPFAWDHRGATFINWIGDGVYGHALSIVGYAKPGVFDASEWLQIENWHGLLYAPLDAGHAAKVEGYNPASAAATSDFWVRRDVLETVMGYGNAELFSATDLDGFAALFDPADAPSPGLPMLA